MTVGTTVSSVAIGTRFGEVSCSCFGDTDIDGVIASAWVNKYGFDWSTLSYFIISDVSIEHEVILLCWVAVLLPGGIPPAITGGKVH